MTQAIKVLNYISYFLFTAIFLLVYAYLPFSVDLEIEGVSNLHKQIFFYYAFGVFLISNIVLRIAINLGTRNFGEELGSWVRSLIFIVNFYLTTLIGFIGVLNNTTSVSPSSYAYLNYMGPVLLIIWIFGLIFLIIKNK
ncbi:MAG: hypothetical protein RLN88_11100 [Ekhidna sp.]|uniref:hypothetical protein n=1 Tax=Ekhidna sp. TaxID=2608089 RepID=UPI0032EBC9F7